MEGKGRKEGNGREGKGGEGTPILSIDMSWPTTQVFLDHYPLECQAAFSCKFHSITGCWIKLKRTKSGPAQAWDEERTKSLQTGPQRNPYFFSQSTKVLFQYHQTSHNKVLVQVSCCFLGSLLSLLSKIFTIKTLYFLITIDVLKRTWERRLE